MIFKKIYMYIIGFIDICVEGFYVENFINLCKKEKIFLCKVKKTNSTILKIRICSYDFNKVREIAGKTNCMLEINRKEGIPFIFNKYKKRKILIFSVLIICVIFFAVTRFIWNIEIIGNEKISNEEILSDLGNYRNCNWKK